MFIKKIIELTVLFLSNQFYLVLNNNIKIIIIYLFLFHFNKFQKKISLIKKNIKFSYYFELFFYFSLCLNLFKFVKIIKKTKNFNFKSIKYLIFLEFSTIETHIISVKLKNNVEIR